ncbi:hypothetical protein K435DRAFT_924740 [Dendrothele bispora CBS 962.96]|uniref:Uncharacterized protein n=1 Tax=Dendrothele bispora (strain CBS 962.96) TaxID=1314807 RepID=A0A4V4HD39_DENBC|nr:hypothetical protein K435DRAFT_924740 [Dendrothele bispora CBS 962.96]
MSSLKGVDLDPCSESPEVEGSEMTRCWLLLSVDRRFSATPGFGLGTERVEGSNVSRQRRGSHEMQSRTVGKQKRRKRQTNTRSVRLQVVWEPIERTTVGEFRANLVQKLEYKLPGHCGPVSTGTQKGTLEVLALMRCVCEPEVAVVAGDGDIANAEEGHDESREQRRWMWVEENYVGCFRLRGPVKPKGV